MTMKIEARYLLYIHPLSRTKSAGNHASPNTTGHNPSILDMLCTQVSCVRHML